MKRYRWSLLKTLEFLNSRRPDLEIRATFIHQLSAYETRLQQQRDAPKITSKWDEISTFALNEGGGKAKQPKTPRKSEMLENEELVLRNTFVNAQMGPLADFRGHMNDHGIPR